MSSSDVECCDRNGRGKGCGVVPRTFPAERSIGLRVQRLVYEVAFGFNVGLETCCVNCRCHIGFNVWKCVRASSVISSMESIIVPGYLSVSCFQNLPIHIYRAPTT